MQDLSETVAQVSQQLGLDAGEIKTRQRFLEFGADDIARLKQVHPQIEDQRGEFAAAFYAHLLKFAPLQYLLADEVCDVLFYFAVGRVTAQRTAGESSV